MYVHMHVRRSLFSKTYTPCNVGGELPQELITDIGCITHRNNHLLSSIVGVWVMLARVVVDRWSSRWTGTQKRWPIPQTVCDCVCLFSSLSLISLSSASNHMLYHKWMNSICVPCCNECLVPNKMILHFHIHWVALQLLDSGHQFRVPKTWVAVTST